MRHSAKFALVILCFAVFPLRGWGATAVVHIPGPNEGYIITHDDHSQAAPAGFEGRTDTSTQTAVGTGALTGKRVVTRFKLGNQVKTCPQADGTSEGEGVFSMSVDSIDAQSNGTTTAHIEMRANANYKGQVADSGYLEDPVNAEIDYTYDQSGTFRGPSGALATPAGSHVVQHITMTFLVSKDFNPPNIGAFAGGDPTKGHYSEAVGTGLALTYWAGIYYSVAQTRWSQGECAQVVFNPPSYTVQPALGTDTTVKAEVKTKGGQSVKATLQGAQAYAGSVNPVSSQSGVGAPFKFIYTAPNKKMPNAGFSVKAVSRAGAAAGEWLTGLGTDWSGQISCMRGSTGDAGGGELQTWSFSGVSRLTIDVKNGVATANGYAEVNEAGVNRQKALRGGALTVIFSDSQSNQGSAEGRSPATATVMINKAAGTYSISAGVESPIEGKRHSSYCTSKGCQEEDYPFYVASCLKGMGGKLTDPNQLHDAINEVRTGTGRSGHGTDTWTVTWDLGRKGTSQ